MLFYTVPFGFMTEDGDDFGKSERYDIQLAIDYNYEPGRPAPYCSNPSNPAYYDAGDQEEIEVTCVQVAQVTNCENERVTWPAEVLEWIAREYERLMRDDRQFSAEIDELIRQDAGGRSSYLTAERLRRIKENLRISSAAGF